MQKPNRTSLSQFNTLISLLPKISNFKVHNNGIYARPTLFQNSIQ